MQPSVHINVNEATGVWETDGLPMLYIPRHFMVNVHNEVESALGLVAYRAVLYSAGAKSAYYWCQQQAKTFGISGLAVFEHYLERLTARGWGQFRLENFDAERVSTEITLRNSIYALETENRVDHPVCYMFEGFFAGGMKYVLEQEGFPPLQMKSREIQCQAMGFEYCKFEVFREGSHKENL
jgi:predicted hydrocarbon binding protein